MKCSADLISAYLDDEIDAAQRAVVDEHLAACPDCSQVYARLLQQKHEIQSAAPRYTAPPHLRQSIRDALRREAQPPAPQTPWRALAIAASLLLAVSLSWNFLQLRPRTAVPDLASAVLADHIRSLIGTHLIDVASSDRHTVKPWFAGKLDFSPAVEDLSPQGFPLAGGRVDYLADRRVAALVYYRRQHVINLFVWPGSSPGTEAGISERGYHLLHWNDGLMTYWAVSDLSPVELQTFRDLLRNSPPGK